MKYGRIIVFLFFAVLWSACRRPVETSCIAASQRQELLAIDSLMWTQPDSALTRLLSCYDTVDDRHYANLLLAELLYKNYHEQTNRTELLEAVAYYDSVSCPFLAARAHYINGVGYYEQDSVVAACAEYLKALKIMEEHFSEKELVGRKAKFMALTYTHLCTLFSDQYLHEQAIHWGKQALSYYNRYDAEPWHKAWILDKIGSHYDMTEQYDSADYYYNKSLVILPDTNNLTYRDIATHRALLHYKQGKTLGEPLDQLQELLEHSESEIEYHSRCLSVGSIYYYESIYDSAWFYLEKVYYGSTGVNAKKQAAEWLVEICMAQGKDSETLEYANYLAPFATQDENNSAIRSQLMELYDNHKQLEAEHLQHQKTKTQRKRAFLIFLGLLVVALGLYVLYRKNKRKKKHLETQIKEEQHAHEIKQKALSGRLKQSNEALRIQEKRANDLAKETDLQRKKKNWDSLDSFMNEGICQEIMKKVDEKQIKREAKRKDYPELQLNSIQLYNLSVAVEKHFEGFEETLTALYPKINRNAMNQCLLYLLNLEDVHIAALLSIDYSTVKKRTAKLKAFFGIEKEPRQFIRELVLRKST